MQTIELMSIKIEPNRQRRDFNAAKLQELTDSIMQHGLFNPVVLRRTPEGLSLVQGERRLRAMSDIYELEGTFEHNGQVVPAGFVPYTLLSSLSALDAEEAELEENIRRVDLTWQEHAAAVLRLKQLRGNQAVSAGLPLPTVADIAVEVRGNSEGINQENTRRELIVAQHLHNPAVKTAKSVDEAFKILRKEESVRKDVALAETVGRTFSAASHVVLNEDSLAWLVTAPTGSFDVIITDPPYGMGADEFGDSGGKAEGAHSYVDSPETFYRCLRWAREHFFRLAKEQAHLYWFCDIDKFAESRTAFEAAGWWVHRTPLIWHKPQAARVPWPEHGPQRKYELLLYAVKGKRPINKIAPDVLTYNPDPNLGHAAQKPVALYADLLARSVKPGNTILDPFAGTGPVVQAGHDLKCSVTALELDPAHYAKIIKRVEQISAQLELGL